MRKIFSSRVFVNRISIPKRKDSMLELTQARVSSQPILPEELFFSMISVTFGN